MTSRVLSFWALRPFMRVRVTFLPAVAFHSMVKRSPDLTVVLAMGAVMGLASSAVPAAPGKAKAEAEAIIERPATAAEKMVEKRIMAVV